MDYERKRGTQYYRELVEDPDDPDLRIVVVKKRRAVALQWEGPNGQIYRAPATKAGRKSLDHRRWRLAGMSEEEIKKRETIVEEP